MFLKQPSPDCHFEDVTLYTVQQLHFTLPVMCQIDLVYPNIKPRKITLRFISNKGDPEYA